ncbi:uncharacterized protein VTP21DRAFT_410 [Calcarisporiella thermophila]|uniref:uncharacterized protein n=1 Tax=Calcarisporiella thermophila TaxID=911321 RepID=UPI0037442C61
MACTALSPTSNLQRSFPANESTHPLQSPSHEPASTSPRKKNMLGPYQLLRTVGEGEFGKVKLGVHSETGIEVAIKLIRKQDVDTASRHTKVEREIFVLRTVRHPNIVKLYDVLETEKYIGIVLEYASGGELFEYILAHRYLKEKDACRLFAQLISGVNYLHRQHIVHRDLKLENLLLDRNRSIIITDFGFANHFGKPEEDLMATSCGSPCYAAPELVVSDGLYVGPAADIWSCGVILYAMLCGFLPYDDDERNPNGDSIGLLYDYILNTELVFPDYVPADARDLLRKMLVVDPKKRCDMQTIMQHRWLAPYEQFLKKSVEQLETEASADIRVAVPGEARFSDSLLSSRAEIGVRPAPVFQNPSTKRHTIQIDYDLDLMGIGSVTREPSYGTEMSRNRIEPKIAGRSTGSEYVGEGRTYRDDNSSVTDLGSAAITPPAERSSPSLGSRHTRHPASSSQKNVASSPYRASSRSPYATTGDLTSTKRGGQWHHGASMSAVPTLLIQNRDEEERPSMLADRRHTIMQLPSEVMAKPGKFGMLLSPFTSLANGRKITTKAENLHPSNAQDTVGPLKPRARERRRKVVSLFLGGGSDGGSRENIWPPPSPTALPPTPLTPQVNSKSTTNKVIGWLRRHSIKEPPLHMMPPPSPMGPSIPPIPEKPTSKRIPTIKSPVAVARAMMMAGRPDEIRLRVHNGAVDQNALTSRPPREVIQHVRETLTEMGIEIWTDTGFKLKCLRPAKQGLISREVPAQLPTPPPTSQSSSNLTTGMQGQGATPMARRKFSVSSATESVVSFLRRGSQHSISPPSQVHASVPQTSNTQTTRVSAVSPPYGDPYLDSGDAVQFTVELCRIRNLTGLYIVDIRRRKGNLWSFRFVYYSLLEKMDLKGYH